MRYGKFADEIAKERIENVETVRGSHEISKQDVVLEEQMVVVAGFDEEEAVLQEFVGIVKIVAEESATRFRQGAFVHFTPDAANCFANLADYVLAVRLYFGNFRAHHVGLLAVLKERAA